MSRAPSSLTLIRCGRADDRDAVVALLAAVYTAGPVAQWLLPDPAARSAAFHSYGGELFDHALDHAVMHLSAVGQAVAVWYPYPPVGSAGVEPAGPRQAIGDDAVLIAAFGGGGAARLELLTDVLAGLRPGTPHHELVHLGVHADHQGQGIAGHLLRHHHAELDRTGVAAYAVAPSRQVRDFYGRHGYAVRERVTVPGGPALWAMSRQPQPDHSEPSAQT
jgi:GNAT superfamily N-acetyltransferase